VAELGKDAPSNQSVLGDIEERAHFEDEEKGTLTKLNRQFEICKRAYENLSSRVEKARIAKAMELGEVKVVSTAFEPRNPVKPRKKRIVAAAGTSSLMLGIFMAFFLESWQKGKNVNKHRAV